MTKVEKAVALVVRERDGVAEILVFDHPSAGTQIVKGTVEDGETPAQAVIRELEEESGLVVGHAGKFIGTWDYTATSGEGGQRHTWHLFWIEAPSDHETAWDYRPSGSPEEEQHVFSFRWTPIDGDLDQRLHPLFGPVALLVKEHLNISMGARPGDTTPLPAGRARTKTNVDAHSKCLLAITGGGSGGHTMPAIAVAQLATNQDLARVIYIGSATGIERGLAEQAGIPFETIRTGKFRRSSRWFKHFQRENLADLFNVVAGIIDSIRILRRLRPDRVLGTGGYVSVPVIAAAAVLRIPRTIHEQTVVFGLANRLAASMANRIALSSELSMDVLGKRSRRKAVVTGNPLRPELLDGTAVSATNRWRLNDEVPTVLVLGGAQGAEAINRAVHDAMSVLLDHCNVVHQSGTGQGLETTATGLTARRDQVGPTQGTYVVNEFFDAEELGDAYAVATLAVGRSGAGTTNELAATKTPAVLIPLVPTGGDEQRKIAEHFRSAGAAMVVPTEDLNGDVLAKTVTRLLKQPEILATMADAGATFHRKNATAPLLQLALGQPEIHQ